MDIKSLNEEYINAANRNSLSGKRGELSEKTYMAYADRIMSLPVSDSKKQQLLDRLYMKYSEILKHEAQHVSIAVTGPAGYNPKRDHSDKIFKLSEELESWLSELEEQAESILDYEPEGTFFKDDNLTAYIKGERVFISFAMKPKPQLRMALKSRGYWWNCWQQAWSTYIDKLDKEWIRSISERYSEYI